MHNEKGKARRQVTLNKTLQLSINPGCGESLSRAESTVDHIRAKKHSGTGSFVNLQLLCTTCNNRKGDEFAAETEVVLHFPIRPRPSERYEDGIW